MGGVGFDRRGAVVGDNAVVEDLNEFAVWDFPVCEQLKGEVVDEFLCLFFAVL